MPIYFYGFVDVQFLLQFLHVTDHGSVFRERFKAAVEAQGTALVKGKLYSCQFNGKVERFFRSFKLWQRLALVVWSQHKIQEHLDTYRGWPARWTWPCPAHCR